MKNKLLSMLRTIGKHIVSIRFTAVIMILAASVVPLLAVRGIVVNSFLERQIKQLETKLLNTVISYQPISVRVDILTDSMMTESMRRSSSFPIYIPDVLW